MISPLFAEVGQLEHVLDFHVERHGLLASNLANADTPGFKPRDLSFSQALAGAELRPTHARHLEGLPTSGFTPREVDIEPHADGSGAQTELAHAQLAANHLRFDEGITIAKMRLGLTRLAATNGGH